MKLIALKCPCCDGEVSLDSDREFVFCKYCGTKIMIQKDAQAIPNVVTITRTGELNNLIERAQRFEDAKDYDSAEIYYNRALDIDPNNVAAYDGYSRVRSITAEPNFFVQRISSNNDPAVRLVVKEGKQVLCKISRDDSASAALSCGEHKIDFYFSGSLKDSITINIKSRRDKVKISCKSKFFGGLAINYLP